MRGADVVGAWRHPDGGFEKCFCRECGDAGVRPTWRTHVAYAAPWAPVPDDGLERYAEGRPRF